MLKMDGKGQQIRNGRWLERNKVLIFSRNAKQGHHAFEVNAMKVEDL